MNVQGEKKWHSNSQVGLAFVFAAEHSVYIILFELNVNIKLGQN